MSFFFDAMRATALTVLTLGAVSCPARATECLVPPDVQFRHYADTYPWHIYLPANARGVLVDIQGGPKGAFITDHQRNMVVDRAPHVVTASQFHIIDKTTGLRIKPVLTAIDSGLPAIASRRTQVWLGHKNDFADGYDRHVEDLAQRAQQHRWRDISDQMAKSGGLFRIGPHGGFQAGHRYKVSYIAHDKQTRSVHADVRTGPAVTINAGDRFDIEPDGPPSHQQSEGQGRIVRVIQPLRYVVPASYAPYRKIVTFHTRQKFSRAEALFLGKRADEFIGTNERDACGATLWEGASPHGPLKDVLSAACTNTGEPRHGRQVKGYVGMLEIEDTLHETAVRDISFANATGAACPNLLRPAAKRP